MAKENSVSVRYNHWLGDEVALDGDHDLVKVCVGDEALVVVVLDFEPGHRVLVVEVVQELGELGVRNAPLLVLAKVELGKVGSLQGERDVLVQSRFGDDLREFV